MSTNHIGVRGNHTGSWEETVLGRSSCFPETHERQAELRESKAGTLAGAEGGKENEARERGPAGVMQFSRLRTFLGMI